MNASTKAPSIGVFSFICFLLGVFLSWGIFSGDNQGRVNLLLLIFLYVMVPLLSLLLTMLLLIFKSKLNLAELLSRLPVWSRAYSLSWQQFKTHSVNQWWILSVSQWLFVAFSAGCIVIFLLSLLFSDVNFVWRSTLLNAEQLQIVLRFIAAPWRFWESAQPTIELLSVSQDSRLVSGELQPQQLQQWWQFVLASQIFYNFVPRLGLAAIARLIWHYQKQNEQPLSIHRKVHASDDRTEPMARICQHLDEQVVLVNWAGFNSVVGDEIRRRHHSVITDEFNAGPLASQSDNQLAERWRGAQLVLVKAWEPPLAELGDYMENGRGYLYPLDLQQDQPVSPTDDDLKEWQRFCGKFPSWKIYFFPVTKNGIIEESQPGSQSL